MNRDADPNQLEPMAPSFRASPLLFVPVLYLVQAIPVTLVQEVLTLVYKDFGVDNESITRWTSIIALPWALQMLFGPLVDLTGAKRRWTWLGQAILAVLIALGALAFNGPRAFQTTLFIFFVAAVASTLCNVATDGFYLLALPNDLQARFSGVQSMCYRIGRLFCIGGLVILAGRLPASMPVPFRWSVVFFIAATVIAIGCVVSYFVLPKPAADVVEEDPGAKRSKAVVGQTGVVVALGLTCYFAASSIVRLAAQAAWRIFDGGKTGVLHGWKLPNNPSIFGISTHAGGVTVEVVQLVVCAAGIAWSLNASEKKIKQTEFGEAFRTYFAQSGIVSILAFLMFYRFSEAMVVKMAPLFMKDLHNAGGLGFSTEQVGAINGTIGPIGIVLGGLLGGFVVSKFGLKRTFWFIAIFMHLPNLLYLWASYAQPGTRPMYGVSFFEQLGYGIGYAGYVIFQMSIANRGRFKTSHFALGVGVGALFINVAGVASGILQANFGYEGLFWAVIAMSFPSLVSLAFAVRGPAFESQP